MKKIFYYIIGTLIVLLMSSCYDDLTNNPVTNKPPKTYISVFADSVISNQQSSVRLHWWADDPDGLVIGYFISVDGIRWKFTSSNDSLISFTILGTDTVYFFRVAAVDNSGNGKYDLQLTSGGINFGSEPFTDLNGNGIWDQGEPYVDCGSIDPNPAILKLPLKNSPPVIRFLVDRNNNTIIIPETTYTVASFGWTISDLDGDNTIKKVFIALNDTSQKIELPPNTRFVTIKASPPFNSNIVDCDVYLGTTINVPYSVKLRGLRLNQFNRFYVYCEDIAGARSSLIAMPAENSNIKWYVKKPNGDILIIDDYGVNDNTALFYYRMMDSLNLSNRYDVWDIKLGKTSTTPPLLLPRILSPMFLETLTLFKVVIWYTDNDPTLEPAQIAIRNYTTAGGKVLFSMMFPQLFDSRGLSDFLPIDSLSPAPISVIPRNTKVNPIQEGLALNYPQLAIDDGTIPVARIRTYYPNPVSAKNLYSLDLPNQPIISFKTADSRIVFMGLPLSRVNGNPFNSKAFLSKVLFQEFGVTQ